MSYHPQGAAQKNDNRLFGMFHSQTDDDVIFRSLSDPSGTVHVVFATLALDMGVDFTCLTSTIHIGLPGRWKIISRSVAKLAEGETRKRL